ncbi:MAG: FkbM family methyltransferase [Planctomycetota bacterium]
MTNVPVQSFGSLVSADEPPFGAFEPRGLQRLLRTLAQIPPFHRGRLRRPMANLIRRMARNGIVDVHFRGAAFRLRPEVNLIEDALLVYPGYNSREIDFLIEGTPKGGVFIDLGSNVGLYTLALAAHIGPEGMALAIDANPDMAAALRFNVAASGFENVRIVNVAVGESASRADLLGGRNDLAIVHVAENPNGNIEIRPLADIVREAKLTRVDTLKADIEGFEDQALIPYLNTVDDALKPKRISIEHLGRAGWKSDLFPVFEQHGYRLVGTTQGNSLFIRG